MLFIVSWSVRAGQRDIAIGRFLKTGAEPPKGVRRINSWHTIGATQGVDIVEVEDPKPLASWSLEWNDVLDISIEAALPAQDAGPLLAAEYQKTHSA